MSFVELDYDGRAVAAPLLVARIHLFSVKFELKRCVGRLALKRKHGFILHSSFAGFARSTARARLPQ